MRRSLAPIAVGAFAGTLLLTGCATMPALPAYESARAETIAAMQRVIDELPPGVRVTGKDDDSAPYPCGQEGEGVFYTGSWDVYTDPTFDVPAFVGGLADRLGEDWVEESVLSEVSFAVVRLRALEYGGTSMDVSDVEDADEPGLHILAISRCAQEPVE